MTSTTVATLTTDTRTGDTPLDQLLAAALRRTRDPQLRRWLARLAADAGERDGAPPRKPARPAGVAR